jgi:diaminopimelate decarboxylase
LKPELLTRLARRFGTPLYAYDFDALARRAKDLARALGPRFTAVYAVKANPSLAVVSFLARRGLGADVASRGELAVALRAGVPPERILATGPAKSDAELAALVKSRVSQIHVEGPGELERLESVAKKLRRRVSVGLRLNPPWGIAETRTIIGGPGAKKFGFDLPSARRALETRSRFTHLDVCGFQVFNASNVLDASLLVENTERVLDLALSLARRYAVQLSTVDFGGGLGVPYTDAERPLDLGTLAAGLQRVARAIEDEPLLASTRLVFEPGRYLVAQMGSYVARVLERKRSRGSDYVLVDGGVHQLLRPALIGTPHRVTSVPTRRKRGRAAVAGPLCTSLDVLHPSAELAGVRPGDLLVFENAGAYGYTESMPLFLSHEWPAEVGVYRGRAARLRKPPRVTQLIDGQIAPFLR